MTPTVIVLSGPIGVGKTALGRALAKRLGGGFIDSDDLRDRRFTWLGEVLSHAQRLVGEVMGMLAEREVVVVAKPLRRRDWALLKGKLGRRGVRAFCVTLAAEATAITGPGRGRDFSAGERARIGEMVAQGYGERDFSDATLRTDAAPFDTTLDALADCCLALLRRPRAR